MDVMIWWVAPVVATFIAIVWTGLLRYKEKKRADEKWRAKRLEKLGPKVIDTRQADALIPEGPVSKLSPRPTRKASESSAADNSPSTGS